MIMVSKLCAGYVLGVNDSLDYINNVYTLKLKQVENMINLHYLAGSKYDTHFWINAQDKANKLYKNRVFYDTEFAEFFNTVKSSKSKIMNRLVDKEFKSSSNDTEYGTWGLHSWYQNIKDRTRKLMLGEKTPASEIDKIKKAAELENQT